jgi:hypothetical protein
MTRPWILLLPLIAFLSVRPGDAAGAPHDPRIGLLRRMDRYFQRHEMDGVVLDSRWVLNETEAVRLSVIPQLLGYAELARQRRSPRFERDIRERADYLVARLDFVRSGSVFDGMLGDALLQAYEVTNDPRHLAAARSVLAELEAIPPSERILNGGLMAALGFAREYHRTGDEFDRQQVADILTLLGPYQHADGSFPHWCPGSTDVHYTAWMAQELILIGRLIDDPRIDPMLARMTAFLEARVGSDGVPGYSGPCPGNPPGCVLQYWSVATGCSIDYDTRGFTNELGYHALVFEHAASARYGAVMGFIETLENGGTFADKWDYPIDPKDPYYPWTAADTSVVNMSLIFWSLAVIPPAVRHAGPVEEEWPGEDDAPQAPVATRSSTLRFEAVTPNPAAGDVSIRLALPQVLPLRVVILDVRGRAVRVFDAPAGARAFSWDGKDEQGRACPRGLYFVRARAGDAEARARLVWTEER